MYFFTWHTQAGLYPRACARSSEGGIAELASWWRTAERGVYCVDAYRVSSEGAGTSTAVTNTGASGVPLAERCSSRCVTKVGVTDLRGVVRRTGRLHGDNTGLVISPHRFLFWDCTLVTYSVYPRNKKCLQHGEFLLTFPPRSPLLLRAGFRKTSL